MATRRAITVGACLILVAAQVALPARAMAQDSRGPPNARWASGVLSAGDLVIYTVDEGGALVPGACFVVTAVANPAVGSVEICDNEPQALGVSDQAEAGGVVAFATANFDVTVTIATVPPGYALAPLTSATYTLGSERPVDVTFVLVAGETNPPTAQPNPMPGAGESVCELVELYPGYPGYRGYVTGLDGVGDHACLRDLESAHPAFDRAREDTENKEAARRIGLNGGPELWTWENWMAVEAERGLPPTCYACAIANAPTRSEPTNTPVAFDDPRLLLGGFGTTAAVNRLAAEHGESPTSAFGLSTVFPYDHQLRAMALMTAEGRHLNATEALEVYEGLVDALTGTGTGADARYVDPGWFWAVLVDQGGYAPTPPTAAPEDQIFTVMVGVEALCPFMTDTACFAMGQRVENSITSWQAERLKGEPISFGEWLRQTGAREW